MIFAYNYLREDVIIRVLTFLFCFLFIIPSLSAQDSLTVIGEIALPLSGEYTGLLSYTYGNLNYKSGGDLNQDGYSDFLRYLNLIDYSNVVLGVYWGDSEPHNYPDSIWMNSVSWVRFVYPSWQGDLNGDGMNDLVSTYTDGHDVCYAGFSMNDGEIDIVSDSTFSFWYWGGFIAWNGGYDFNADGYDDILCLDYTSESWEGNVDILYGGNIMDTSVDVHFEGDEGDFFMLGDAAFVGDVNGDGNPDLLLTHVHYNDMEGTLYLSVYCGGEDFDNTPEQTIEMDGALYMVGDLSHLASNGDFNGDGFDDTIWADEDTVHVLWGSEDLSFPQSSLYIGHNADPLQASGCRYCNINNDQYDDIMTKMRYADHAYFHLGGESIPETPGYAVRTDTTNSWYIPGYNMGDVNGDGHNDVFIFSDDNYSQASIYSLDPVSNEDEPEIHELNRMIWNFPNPFRYSTSILLDIPTDQLRNATIEIYNVRGQRVRQLSVSRENVVNWDTRDEANHPVASGVYFYRLKGKQGNSTIQKMLYIK